MRQMGRKRRGKERREGEGERWGEWEEREARVEKGNEKRGIPLSFTFNLKLCMLRNERNSRTKRR